MNSFRGTLGFLSNFYASPFTDFGVEWPTVEHFFAAQKTTDPVEREAVRQCKTPGQAKRMGREVTLRPDWNDIKLSTMWIGLCLKFYQNPELKARLIATGDRPLVENNSWHDNLWGNCTCDRCSHPGQNILGKYLMDIRNLYPMETHHV